MGPEQELPLRVRVYLGVMAMKRSSILPKVPELEPYYWMQFNVIPRAIRPSTTAF